MRLLITGASGMVGNNLREHPSLRKFDAILPTRSELNLANLASVENYLSTNKPDLVVHAAGLVGGIQKNLQYPVEFLVQNIDINRNLIGTCRKFGITKLLNLGSSCMYPRNLDCPLEESMVLKGELEPTNEGYALAKIMAQRLCDYIMREDSTYQYKTLIPCNLYGRFDNFHPDHSHMIPAVIRKIHQAKVDGASEVEIWGNGEARREFMYAGDLADCIFRAIENFDTLPALMNVGLGYDLSINEYYKAVAEVVGYSGTYSHNLSKPVGMKRKLVAVELMKSWGWESQTTLHEGIQKSYQYFLAKNSEAN